MRKIGQAAAGSLELYVATSTRSKKAVTLRLRKCPKSSQTGCAKTSGRGIARKSWQPETHLPARSYRQI